MWAVKPQSFNEAAAPVAPHAGSALQLSVMAGIRSGDIAHAVGHGRIVRCMPNTPALVGQGMTGLFAAPDVSPPDRALAERWGKGGTAPVRVREQIAAFTETCARQRRWAMAELTGAALRRSPSRAEVLA